MIVKKDPVIHLPVNLVLTPQGAEWFIRHRRRLSQLRLADNRLEYGLSVPNIFAASLQKLISVDYITSIELARTEFSSKRQQIVDLSKLIVYRILFKKFEHDTFRLFLRSPLVKRWNRLNPARIIDAETALSRRQLDSLLADATEDIPKVSEDIQEPLFRRVLGQEGLSEDERELRCLLSDSFVISMNRVMWCVLVRSRGQPEYDMQILQIRQLVSEYIERALISEYLALMIVELLNYTEMSHYQRVARQLPDGRKATDSVLSSERVRAAVQRRMQETGDLLTLTYQITGRGASIGTENRLRVTVYNQGREYQRIKEQLEKKAGPDIEEHSLLDFYQKVSREEPFDTGLALAYLSYLQTACQKQNVRVEATVNRSPRHDLTILNLTLQL